MSTRLSTAPLGTWRAKGNRPATSYPGLEQYLELLLGPKDKGSSFASEESRRMAWRAHAAELIRLVDAGSRPWAWWQYDAPEPVLPRERPADYLARCGLLTEGERRSLRRAGQTSHATRKP